VTVLLYDLAYRDPDRSRRVAGAPEFFRCRPDRHPIIAGVDVGECHSDTIYGYSVQTAQRVEGAPQPVLPSTFTACCFSAHATEGELAVVRINAVQCIDRSVFDMARRRGFDP
jgi:hypothetical protein